MKPTKKLSKDILTPLQAKRVAILKDAIKQIENEVYIAQSCNGYVVSNVLHKDIDILCDVYSRDSELKPFIDILITPAKPCEVCAKGAILISAIRKFNNCSLGDAEDQGLDEKASYRAQQLFGTTNADLMEKWFETDSSLLFDDYDDIYKWDYLTDNAKLILIFKNAIQNKGIFKPKQIKL